MYFAALQCSFSRRIATVWPPCTGKAQILSFSTCGHHVETPRPAHPAQKPAIPERRGGPVGRSELPAPPAPKCNLATGFQGLAAAGRPSNAAWLTRSIASAGHPPPASIRCPLTRPPRPPQAELAVTELNSPLRGVCRGKWHAARWPSPKGRSRGSSSLQRGCAKGQRVRNRQPLGGVIADGSSP